MHEINMYDNSMEILKRRESNIYIKFVIILIICFILMIIISVIKYPKEHLIEGVVSDNKIMAYLTKDSLTKLKGNTLKINDVEMYYELENITELDYDMNYEKYYLVTISVDKKLIENDVVNIVIDDGKTNLYNDFIKRIWKGFNNE